MQESRNCECKPKTSPTQCQEMASFHNHQLRTEISHSFLYHFISVRCVDTPSNIVLVFFGHFFKQSTSFLDICIVYPSESTSLHRMMLIGPFPSPVHYFNVLSCLGLEKRIQPIVRGAWIRVYNHFHSKLRFNSI